MSQTDNREHAPTVKVVPAPDPCNHGRPGTTAHIQRNGPLSDEEIEFFYGNEKLLANDGYGHRV
jgi:hypothetical protein